MMNETIQIRLPSDVKKQFVAVVNFEGSTITDEIREFIDRKIASYAEAKSKSAL